VQAGTGTGRRLCGCTVLVMVALFGVGCSIQEASLAPRSSVVAITYEQPEDDSPVGIRTSIAGTGERLTVNDWAFADELGRTSVVTRSLQNTYLVARSERHDAAYQRVDVTEFGTTVSVTSVVGTTSVSGVVVTTDISPARLVPKTTGEALIVFVENDWPFGPVTDVKVVGQDVRFEPDRGMRQLYDDGTNGDFRANDRVWSVRFTVGTTSYGYGFVVNDHRDTVYRDPHEEHSEIFVDRQGFPVRRSVIAIRTY